MKPSLLLLLLAAAAPAHARIHPLAPVLQEKATADPLDELRTEWETKSRDITKAGAGASEKIAALRAEIGQRARVLAETDPRGLLAVRTRVWMASEGIVDSVERARIYEDLLEKDMASPGLAALADALHPGSLPEARSMLETLLAKSGDRTVRGRALRTLSDHAKRERERMSAVEQRKAEASVLAREFGAERAMALEQLGVAGVEKQYVALLERVVKEFGDVQDARGRAIGPRAEGSLFEMQRLQIGMLAPDIEGEDVHGVPFKLSEYRGKVIFLDFWGHW